MMMLMFVLTAGYVFFIFCYTKHKVIRGLQDKMNDDVRSFEEASQRLRQEKDSILSNKTKLENKANEIFTLYEITKEITAKLDEHEAFEVFKSKLREKVKFDECQMTDGPSKEHHEV